MSDEVRNTLMRQSSNIKSLNFFASKDLYLEDLAILRRIPQDQLCKQAYKANTEEVCWTCCTDDYR